MSELFFEVFLLVKQFYDYLSRSGLDTMTRTDVKFEQVREEHNV